MTWVLQRNCQLLHLRGNPTASPVIYAADLRHAPSTLDSHPTRGLVVAYYAFLHRYTATTPDAIPREAGVSAVERCPEHRIYQQGRLFEH